MYRILIVEDDRNIAAGISKALTPWGMDARGVNDLSQVMKEFAAWQPHLVLMDIGLPFMDGYHWCREIRKSSAVPIMFLSSASDNMNLIMAMNMGADDFIAKPFDLNVLIAKLQALLRRAYDLNQAAPVLTCGEVTLDTGDNSLHVRDKKVELSRNEYRIALVLLQNKGSVVSREKLMEALWETDTFVDENALTVNVGRLRKKLSAAGLPDFITTKFGVGYLVEAEK